MSEGGVAGIYADAARRLRDINALEGIQGLLGWDEMVMLPAGSSGSRGDQKTVLAGVVFDKKTDPKLGEALEKLREPAAQNELNPVERAVVRDASKSFKRISSLPKALAQREAALETEAYNSWVEARTASDFSKFEPSLREWVELSKQKAKYIDSSAVPYDVLLDAFEKGMSSQRLDEVFTQLREGLVPLIAEIKQRGTAPDASWLNGKYDLDQQAKLCNQVALDLGFDLQKGRLDKSVHPFTGGAHPTDVRMTTRFKEDDLTEGLTGAVHETGHALYEQGRNLADEWKDLPVNVALSMGVHESQSLLWERMVALGRPFQHYLLPKIREFFPTFSDKATPESLYQAQNVLRDPSLIRVEADELTYSLHVVLRYEIEKGLIDGTIDAASVPQIWNDKMQSYLGVLPPNDAKGALQDVHWSGGAIGYFPTYTLGAIAAAQIFATAQERLPGLDEQLAKGEFAPLREWLRKNVHERGSFCASADELMLEVTGKPLDAAIYVDYLTKKFRELYKL